MRLLMSHEITAVMVITKVTANPIPLAEPAYPETPRKGQMPRKYERTKLLTTAAPMKMMK
jgi:hypothetical protein